MSLENLPSCDLVMLFVRQFHHFDSPTGTSTRNDMIGDRQVTNGEKRGKQKRCMALLKKVL